MPYRLTKTVTIAATAVVAGLGLTACNASAGTSAHSAASTARISTSSSSATPSATPSTTKHSKKATHSARATAHSPRATTHKVSRDQARPTVSTRLVNTAETVAFHTVRKYDPTLAAGNARVERGGVPGKVTTTWRQQLAGSVVARTTLVKRRVTEQPVNRVLIVGTKYAAPKPVNKPAPKAATGGGLDLSRAAMWDRIAQCESTGNWHINSGNGYFGGLQFDLGTWQGAGGGKFAPRADLASRAQQITIANHVYASRGLSPWQCGWAA